MLEMQPMIRLRIRELAEARGLSLTELADRIGMMKHNLEKLANEQTTSYRRESLNDVAWGLGVRVGDLFIGEPEEPEKVRNILAHRAALLARADHAEEARPANSDN